MKINNIVINNFSNSNTISIPLKKLKKANLFAIFGNKDKLEYVSNLILFALFSKESKNVTNFSGNIEVEFEVDENVYLINKTKMNNNITAVMFNKTKNVVETKTEIETVNKFVELTNLSLVNIKNCFELPFNEVDNFLNSNFYYQKRFISSYVQFDNFGKELENKINNNLFTLNSENGALDFQLKQFGSLSEIKQSNIGKQIENNNSKIKRLQFELKNLNAQIDICLSDENNNKKDNDKNNGVFDNNLNKIKSDIFNIEREINKLNYENENLNLKFNENVKLLVEQNEIETKQHFVHNKIKQLNVLKETTQNSLLEDFAYKTFIKNLVKFANNYIFKISRGKYYLKYDEQFKVINNFNANEESLLSTLPLNERMFFVMGLSIAFCKFACYSNNINSDFLTLNCDLEKYVNYNFSETLKNLESLIKLNFTSLFLTDNLKFETILINNVKL